MKKQLITTKVAKSIYLRDDATETGGISHSRETLYEFIKECDLRFGFRIEKYNPALKECGIEEITQKEVDKASNPLGIEDVNLLNKIARITRKDCWFQCEYTGLIRDYENGGNIMDTKLGVYQLLEGNDATETYKHFSQTDMVRLVEILAKLII